MKLYPTIINAMATVYIRLERTKYNHITFAAFYAPYEQRLSQRTSLIVLSEEDCF